MNRFIGLSSKCLGRLIGTGICVDSYPVMGRVDKTTSDGFDGIVHAMTTRYHVRIKRWRKQMSGCAWSVLHHNGRTVNWIEAPIPKTPISLAIFLHEVGHHAIGFNRYRRRCEEEYHVWIWAMNQMQKLGVEPDERVTKRFRLSMQYAVGKAIRRGIKELPAPLMQFAPCAA